MKNTIATLVVATLATTVLAQHKMDDVHATGKGPKIKCAVLTGSTVNIAQATKNHMYSDYKGHRYYFCCADCPKDFKKNPAKYAKNAHMPIPKAHKH